MSNDDEITHSVSRKKTALESRLRDGRVQVHLDSTIEGVILPDYLMGQVQVILNLSYGFKPEVFLIDELGVQVTLSFGGKKFLCVLPWACVYVMQTLDSKGTIAGESEIFIESLPTALVKKVSRSQVEKVASKSSEAEHTPEKGIISLQRFKKDRSDD